MKNLYIIILAFIVLSSCNESVKVTKTNTSTPNIFPDYIGVTIPANIAPLNFKVKEDYSKIDVLLKGKNESLHIQSSRYADFPLKEWNDLLNTSKGDSIQVTVSVKKQDNWLGYQPFYIYISNDDVDKYLAYRLIAPGYEVYSKMGIYQRSLTDFKQDAIYENTLVQGSCVNCHSFNQGSAKDMSMHIRGKFGGTVLMTNNHMEVLKTKTDETLSKFVYPYWHPSGKYIAYTLNDTHQVFHSSSNKRVEVFDNASDVIVYDINKNEIIKCDALMSDSVFETFPSFSSDGKTLYFCSAKAEKMPMEYTKVHYDLCSISFDPATGTFADKVDTLFKASDQHKSVTFPRPSPDGKYVMFTLVDYGNFSIWHKEADLYLLDTQTNKVRSINEVNSNDTESYHSWSTNSKWFVFSSRRLNGLYTRSYIAHMDENGKAGKPFLLPQKNINFYDDLLFSFNIPEFITSKVTIDIPELEKQLKGEKKQVEVRK
nr:hypothetical protein [uncultured Carboxylicivirga sp.]